MVDDDAQGAQLKALTANGKFGQAIDFSQKGQSLADLIAALARQHYLVNSTATDNFDYQTGANHQADDAKNQFVIHFVHEKIPTQRTATITRTVHYQYENGQLADDDQVAQQVVTQTGEKIWSRIRNIMISNGRRMLRLKPGDSQVTWVTRPKLMIK
ncbi:mucin-binding protein [Limosilactobacillus ingluviei]|uniref:mucin-binding protein n=1 Tax=Limosilactobacillus ingluviei TaxID=148604 RepID=UPI003D2ED1C6